MPSSFSSSSSRPRRRSRIDPPITSSLVRHQEEMESRPIMGITPTPSSSFILHIAQQLKHRLLKAELELEVKAAEIIRFQAQEQEHAQQEDTLHSHIQTLLSQKQQAHHLLTQVNIKLAHSLGESKRLQQELSEMHLLKDHCESMWKGAEREIMALTSRAPPFLPPSLVQSVPGLSATGEEEVKIQRRQPYSPSSSSSFAQPPPQQHERIEREEMEDVEAEEEGNRSGENTLQWLLDRSLVIQKETAKAKENAYAAAWEFLRGRGGREIVEQEEGKEEKEEGGREGKETEKGEDELPVVGLFPFFPFCFLLMPCLIIMVIIIIIITIILLLFILALSLLSSILNVSPNLVLLPLNATAQSQ
ncbi:hypothetical protein VYU27_001783 [Nannochloropsis oceanica]